MVKLGEKVKDTVSGFTGIAVVKHEYLHGCFRFTIQPGIDKEGKHPDSCTFDEPQLVKAGKGIKVSVKKDKTGGASSYVDEGRD